MQDQAINHDSSSESYSCSVRSVVEISGSDALQLLQRLTTNDLAKNTYCYTYLLDQNGRYLFDFFIFKKSSEYFLIDIAKAQTEGFIQKIRSYILRSNVNICDQTLKYSVLYTPALLSNSDIIHSSKDPRFDSLGFRSIIASTNEKFGNLYLQHKYEFGIPDGITDMIISKSFPMEFGIDELRAVSYSKGCYLGQEIVARTKHVGDVRKKIFTMINKKNANTDAKELNLIIDEISAAYNIKNLGFVCSVYKNSAIILLNEEKYSSIDPEFIDNFGIELSIPPWRILK